MYGSQKVLGKEKNDKKNYFLMFGCFMKNSKKKKKSNIIKTS